MESTSRWENEAIDAWFVSTSRTDDQKISYHVPATFCLSPSGALQTSTSGNYFPGGAGSSEEGKCLLKQIELKRNSRWCVVDNDRRPPESPIHRHICDDDTAAVGSCDTQIKSHHSCPMNANRWVVNDNDKIVDVIVVHCIGGSSSPTTLPPTPPPRRKSNDDIGFNGDITRRKAQRRQSDSSPMLPSRQRSYLHLLDETLG